MNDSVRASHPVEHGFPLFATDMDSRVGDNPPFLWLYGPWRSISRGIINRYPFVQCTTPWWTIASLCLCTSHGGQLISSQSQGLTIRLRGCFYMCCRKREKWCGGWKNYSMNVNSSIMLCSRTTTTRSTAAFQRQLWPDWWLNGTYWDGLRIGARDG